MSEPLAPTAPTFTPAVTASHRDGRGRGRGRVLALVTLAVLLAHWGLLYGLPLTVAAFQGHGAAAPAVMDRAFVTRTVTLDAPAPPPPQAAPIAPAIARMQKFVAPPSAPDLAPNNPLAPADTAQTAIESIANATPDVQMAAASPAPPTASARLPDAMAVQNYAIPGSVRLKYDIKGEVKGFPYFANGELLWLQDSKTYDARLEISHFLLGSRVQTSTGQLGRQGLEPTRFGDKVRSEVAAHFERTRGVVVFSANSPDAPLLPGAQDQLSVFMQLASMLGGNVGRFPAGTQLPFQAIGPRSAESWVFEVGATEMQTLPGGSISAVKLMRAPVSEHDARVEVWLAPEMAYMPVRIRLTQGSGDFVEQQWSSTQKP